MSQFCVHTMEINEGQCCLVTHVLQNISFCFLQMFSQTTHTFKCILHNIILYNRLCALETSVALAQPNGGLNTVRASLILTAKR